MVVSVKSIKYFIVKHIIFAKRLGGAGLAMDGRQKRHYTGEISVVIGSCQLMEQCELEEGVSSKYGVWRTKSVYPR
jgi:hypothetical protein